MGERRFLPIIERDKLFTNEILMTDTNKKFGISIQLPENDPMAAPHLLGDDWQGERWYDSASARDAALIDIQNHPIYYRQGDTPSIVLTKIER